VDIRKKNGKRWILQGSECNKQVDDSFLYSIWQYTYYFDKNAEININILT
jgi:hypothetical protein